MTKRLKMLGFGLNIDDSMPNSIFICLGIVMIVLACVIFYFLSCLVVIALNRLFGIVEFSWMNGLWMFILLLTIYLVQKGKDD